MANRQEEEECIQKLVMIMDMNGYEQDGDGPTFVNVGGAGETMRFDDWEGVYEFVVKNFAKEAVK